MSRVVPAIAQAPERIVPALVSGAAGGGTPPTIHDWSTAEVVNDPGGYIVTFLGPGLIEVTFPNVADAVDNPFTGGYTLRILRDDLDRGDQWNFQPGVQLLSDTGSGSGNKARCSIGVGNGRSDVYSRQTLSGLVCPYVTQVNGMSFVGRRANSYVLQDIPVTGGIADIAIGMTQKLGLRTGRTTSMPGYSGDENGLVGSATTESNALYDFPGDDPIYEYLSLQNPVSDGTVRTARFRVQSWTFRF